MEILEAMRATHEQHHKSVVLVINDTSADAASIGSGFIIKSTGPKAEDTANMPTKILVMTCWHCIQGSKLRIRLAGSSREYPADMMHENEVADLAILAVDVLVMQPVLKFRESSSDVGIGELVFLAAYFHPGPDMVVDLPVVCLNPAVHPGRICAPLKELKQNPMYNSVVHSCRSQCGCSGGALIFGSQIIGVQHECDTQIEHAWSSETVNVVMKEWLHLDVNGDETIQEMIDML